MLASQVLSSASILLAILTALYGLFYPAIKEVIEVDVKTGSIAEDNEANLHKATRVRRGKVWPLEMGVVMLFVIFLPEAWKDIRLSVTNLVDYGFSGTEYDITVAAFLAVTLFTFVQMCNILVLAGKVRRKEQDLKKEYAAAIAEKSKKNKT